MSLQMHFYSSSFSGLFAADTLRDVKPNRQHLNNVPTLSPQYRANNSTNFLLASSEQNHHQIQQYLLSSHEIQQYYPLDNTSAMLIDTSNSSRMTTSGIRDGFRPSTVRHPSFRLMTATTQRNPRSFESRETSVERTIHAIAWFSTITIGNRTD